MPKAALKHQFGQPSNRVEPGSKYLTARETAGAVSFVHCGTLASVRQRKGPSAGSGGRARVYGRLETLHDSITL